MPRRIEFFCIGQLHKVCRNAEESEFSRWTPLPVMITCACNHKKTTLSSVLGVGLFVKCPRTVQRATTLAQRSRRQPLSRFSDVSHGKGRSLSKFASIPKNFPQTLIADSNATTSRHRGSATCPCSCQNYEDS